MTHALNLTLPIKQDAETQAKLGELAKIFETQLQPVIEEALKKSRFVHFARTLVIDNKYIQVITEFEGDWRPYAEFFREELTPVFAAIFTLAEGAPDVTNADAFFDYAVRHNICSLGKSTDGSTDHVGNPEGFLFSAYPGKTVEDILKAVESPKSAT
jgi:hypothetical protein